MTNAELLIRAGAVVAAVAVLAGPYLVAQARRVSPWLSFRKAESAPLDDAHTVLEIARRLQTSGSKRGVELCQQLIDVMLSPPEAKA